MPTPPPRLLALQCLTLERRRFLSLAGAASAGLAGLALVGCGDDDKPSGTTPGGNGSTRTDGSWKQPSVIQSANGRLDVTLTVKGELVPHGNRKRWAITVNGTSPGPTLLIRPGDRLRIVLDNQLEHSTNLHTHGLRVSPSGNADNPFVEVKAGEKFTYEMDVPADHPSGLSWYHPHLHHHVAEQLFAGMFGAIVIRDAIDDLPEIAGATERMVLLHDTRDATSESGVTSATMMDTRDGREGNLVLANGLAGQRLPARVGQLERWRLLNASPSRFYRLRLDGHSFRQIASDGGRLAAPEEVTEITLVPGERAEVLVEPTKEGSYTLRALPVSRGMMGASRELELLAMDVAAGGTAARPAFPARLANLRNLDGAALATTREITMEMQMGGGPPRFRISGKEFDANRIDTRVRLGTVEDWMIRNVGPMDHPFHLHVWPFQVMEQSAPGAVPKGWKDTVNVPAGGFVRVRIPFEQIGGKTVYHCHILDHEDLGMMAIIEAT